MPGTTQILIEFNDKAKKIFFSLYDKFKESAKKLDRTKDNNVFQQQEGKYLSTLRFQLESTAQECLNKTRSPDKSELNKKLTNEITMYLNEFRQKTRSL